MQIYRLINMNYVSYFQVATRRPDSLRLLKLPVLNSRAKKYGIELVALNPRPELMNRKCIPPSGRSVSSANQPAKSRCLAGINEYSGLFYVWTSL